MANEITIIEGGYVRDILAQPDALSETLAGLECSEALDAAAQRLRGGGFDRIVLTAMGGSYWALQPLHLDLLRSGYPSLLLETSELIHYTPGVLDSNTLLIVNSQSGRSVEMLRMLGMKDRACVTIAVTNTADSPLAQQADAVLETRAGVEYTVSCKTWVAALMALKWLADALGGRSLERSKEELAAAAPAVAGYLGGWRNHVREAVAQLEGVRNYFLLGRGPSMAAVGTGGLITKESARIHSEGMSAAAFRHGPFEMIDGGLYALVFEGDPVTAPLNRKLAEDIVRAGGRSAVVGEATNLDVFRLPKVAQSVRPIMEILTVEMITLAFGAMAGREAGKFERATKVTSEE